MNESLILHVMPPHGCHCFSTGLVLMDDRSDSFAEPCPMCTLGWQRSMEYVTWDTGSLPPMETKQGFVPRDRLKPKYLWTNRDGNRIKEPSWYHLVNVAMLTWNNGLTVFHSFPCATIGCTRFVTEKNERCVGCVPTELASVVPSARAITAARKAKAAGDERTLFDLSRRMELEMRERMHAARVAEQEAVEMQVADNTRAVEFAAARNLEAAEGAA